ncbi:MAG: ABC transporter permease [Chloroflexi bacterium]|nr:ABC transporter permease [Chloroflexota bacterium]
MAVATRVQGPLAPQSPVATVLQRKPSGLYSDAWRRMRKNKATMVGLSIIIAFVLIAVFASVLAPHNALQSYSGYTFRPAAWVSDPDPTRAGDPRFLFGTDAIGRDVLSRLIYGARTSLIVGLVPMLIILTVGTTVGLIAGFAGGKVDNLLMRITDIIYAFPDLLFFILMMTALRDTWIGNLLNGLILLFVSLAIVNWVGVARLVRGQVLSLKEKEFVEAARMVGADRIRIMLKHLLPNSLAPIIVSAAFIIPNAILVEAILGYLGVGMRPATDPASLFPTSWGGMLLEGRDAINAQIFLLITPAIAIATIMLSFTFVGDGLRDALDPMMKGKI